MDVAVVGGGVIGCAIARELALAGLEVVLLERSQPGANASWAAAGMLSPLAEAHRADAFLSLLLDSRRMYPAYVADLREETGVDVGYRDEGTLLVALDEGDEHQLRERFRWQQEHGLAVEWLEGSGARALEPSLNPAVRAALRFAEDHQVDNRLLSSALWTAAERAGATMRRGADVVRLIRRAGRAEGVQLADGETVGARWVVLAGGAWTPELADLPRPVSVHPVHGQLLALRPASPTVRHVVDSPRAYLVPRGDGRLIVGATVEEIGFRREVTAGGLHALLEAALEIVPDLARAPLVETWSGHRPGTADGRPILGADPELSHLVYATGHFRNGILLVPITARVVADLVLQRSPQRDLEPFSPARFAGDMVRDA